MEGGAWLCIVSCEVPCWSIAVAVAEDANAVTQSNADGDQFQITKHPRKQADNIVRSTPNEHVNNKQIY